MKKELDNILTKNYPKLYKDRNNPKSCMFFGFPGDGWFKLIDNLSYKLERIIDKNPNCGLRALQVKEKFGVLRFYYWMNEIIPEVDKLVREAEQESSRTCEDCGLLGTSNNLDGYVMTGCQSCVTKEKKRRKI